MDTLQHNWSVGHDVKLRISSGEEISGTVFAWDPTTSMLLLREPGAHNGVATLRFLNLQSSVVDAVLSDTAPKMPVDLKLPKVDLEICKRREAKALQLAEYEASRVGVGVTKEAQAIFEALCKTLPCVWREQMIVVLDEVVISEPYTAETCRGLHADIAHAPTLERVRKVLQAERQRLGLI